MNLTKEQSLVVNTRYKNILVSASAGSGKTFVLVKRIIELLREGNSIDDFLVFTFTKASASEMKTRLKEELLKDKELYKEYVKISNSHISTIHAFCSFVIKEQFAYLNVDPSINIAIDTELEIIKYSVLEEIIEERFLNNDKDFLSLVEFFPNIEETIIKVSKFLEKSSDKEKLIEDIKNNYKDYNYLENIFNKYIEDRLLEAKELISENEKNIVNEKTKEILEKDFIVVDEFSIGEDYKFSNLVRPKNMTLQEKELYQEFGKTREKYKEILKGLKNDITNSFSDSYKIHMSNYEILNTLLDIATEFDQKFFTERIKENKLSFNDLETLSYKALKNKDISDYYRRKFKYIFIDEYQDTSEIQEKIVSLIKRDNNLFMVGDIKQSIYGFRNARPDIFLDKYNSYPKIPNSIRIDLNMNFRSSSSVIDSVNEVFNKSMTKDFSGIDYKKDSKLIYGSKKEFFYEDKTKIVSVSSDNKEKEEIKFVINEIKALQKKGVKLRDIAILIRNPKPYLDKVKELFFNEKIDLFIDYTESFLDSLEVELIVNYLKLIDNSKRDIPLISILRLKRYSFTNQELYDIREDKELDFYTSLINYNKEDETKKKIDFFLEELKYYRKISYLPLDELIQKIYYGLGFEKFILSLNNPVLSLSNIRRLFSIANEFEKTTLVGLNKFLRYLSDIKKKNLDLQGAKVFSDESDVVRLMSIHKSKGLEFKIVFLLGSYKRYNEKDYNGDIIMEKDIILLSYKDIINRVNEKSEMIIAFSHYFKEELRKEELRILYVALTRAVDRLYITTTSKDKKEKKLNSINNFQDIILSSYNNSFITETFTFKDEEKVKEEDYKVKYDSRKIEKSSFLKTTNLTKVSVTELTHSEKVELKEINVHELEKFKRGNLFHKILEHIDFNKDYKSEMIRLKEIGVIDSLYLLDMLSDFYNSEVFQYIKKAKYVEKELEFIYKKDYLIQGVIDLVIHLDEGVILVDYKTDKTKKFLDEYKKQISLYKEAYENIRKEKVIKKILHFSSLNESIIVE